MLPNPALTALRRFTAEHPERVQHGTLGIAFSGGADSTALLHAALALWPSQRLCALHVNHGLQHAAAGFAQHAAQACATLGVPFAQADLQLALQRGQSVEEQAREGRYQALARLAQDQGCGLVLLGQHGDDQVESVLLALLRGAGPRGLAAMPEWMWRHGCAFARPLLCCGAAELRAWLDGQGIGYLIDPMNADPAFRRSRIRHELVPVLAQLEPAYRQTLSRTAALCAATEAQTQARAAQRLRLCTRPGGLDLATLRQLGAAAASEVVRLWLRQHGQRLDRARTDELVRQVLRTAQGAQRLALRLPCATVRREGALLVLHRDATGCERA